MRKLTTLSKTLENITAEQLTQAIQCENVDAENLTQNEKFSVLIFTELAKALNTKSQQLVLDCNYAQSKMHKNENFLVTYYRLISTDTKNASMIQLYITCNAKKSTAYFHLCTSCAKVNREQFEALESELHFTVKRDKNNRAKTTERKRIPYEEVVPVVKSVVAVLSNNATATAV